MDGVGREGCWQALEEPEEFLVRRVFAASWVCGRAWLFGGRPSVLALASASCFVVALAADVLRARVAGPYPCTVAVPSGMGEWRVAAWSGAAELGVGFTNADPASPVGCGACQAPRGVLRGRLTFLGVRHGLHAWYVAAAAGGSRLLLLCSCRLPARGATHAAGWRPGAVRAEVGKAVACPARAALPCGLVRFTH